MDENKYVTLEMFEQYHKKLMEYIGMHDDLILTGETTCPKCGAKLLRRASKKTGKKFYGCSNYPTCDFAAPGAPTGEVCKECGGFIISGFRGRKFCMNNDCPTREQPKTTKKAKK